MPVAIEKPGRLGERIEDALHLQQARQQGGQPEAATTASEGRLWAGVGVSSGWPVGAHDKAGRSRRRLPRRSFAGEDCTAPRSRTAMANATAAVNNCSTPPIASCSAWRCRSDKYRASALSSRSSCRARPVNKSSCGAAVSGWRDFFMAASSSPTAARRFSSAARRSVSGSSGQSRICAAPAITAPSAIMAKRQRPIYTPASASTPDTVMIRTAVTPPSRPKYGCSWSGR